MLPAVEAADSAIGTLIGNQPRQIAIGPDEPLQVRGLQLAVPSEEVPLIVEEKDRTVHAAGRSASLCSANHDVNAMLCRGRSNRRSVWAGNLNRIRQIVQRVLLRLRARQSLDEEWVARQPALSEAHDIRAHLGGVRDQLACEIGGGV